LTRLVADGFVRTQTHQGFQRHTAFPRGPAELTYARLEIESLVLRLSVRDGDMAWEAAAVAAHHVLARTRSWYRTTPATRRTRGSAAHAAFHRALLAGCPNRRLLATAIGLREEASSTCSGRSRSAANPTAISPVSTGR